MMRTRGGITMTASASPWFDRHPRAERARVTLFCLPFSGGGASVFTAWRELFPPEIEVCPVHLPGREERIAEPAAISATEIARALTERIDRPYALYGHSIGARLGFEVLRELASLGMPAALRFYPAASLPPDVASTLYESVLLGDDAFLDVLIRRLGAPAELRDTLELRQLLLPLLRSDLDWGYRYRYRPGPPLATTILALSGESDAEATARQMAGWSRQGERFSQRTVRGGHFFVKTAARQLAELLTTDLLDALPHARPLVSSDASTAAGAEDHAVTLDGRWSVWRDALLRSAGFPVDDLALLAAGDCARVADDHLAGNASHADFQAAFTEAARGNSALIHRLAGDRLLREAITWQNRSALVAMDEIWKAGAEPRRSARHRQRERMVARYWQRYCVKAETIGFFGPVCWTSIDPAEPGVTAVPGRDVIRARTVYLEYWALAALAERIAGQEVIDPVRPPVRLTAAQAAVLRLCDGRRPGWRVAAEAVADPDIRLRSVADAYLLLEHLVARGIVHWDFNLPVSLEAETALREQISRIGDRAAREAAEAKLAELSARRDQVAAAAGDPDDLARALECLDRTFTELSGRPPTRRPGEMYAGRTLCVEETNRDLDVRFGKPVLDAVAAPLALLLTATHWLCGTLAEAYLGELDRLFAELAPGADGEVPLGQLWFLAQDSFYGTVRRPLTRVTDELNRRWAQLLALDPVRSAQPRLSFSSAELSGPVTDLFPAVRRTWAAARIHSPDLVFCASSAESFARGDFTVVLGEMHAAWAAAGCAAAVAGHPDPARLRQALRRDMAGRSVYTLLPPDWPRNTPRLAFALEDPRDVQLGFAAAPGADRQRLVPISSVTVRRTADSLTAVGADGRTWPLAEIFGRPLSELAVEAFKSVGAGPHTPRISVDRLVVTRESWRVAVRDCPATSASGERDEYLAVRRWKAALGLPEHVFVKLAAEVKPLFIDLTSPVYASVLAAALRSTARKLGDAASLTVTEMLPAPDRTWLTDASGRRYVAELRLHVRDDLPGHTRT
jgi:surfactin synthase thioesterase subunit